MVSEGSPGDENQEEFTCCDETKSSIMVSCKTGQKDHRKEWVGMLAAAEVISQDFALLPLSAL